MHHHTMRSLVTISRLSSRSPKRSFRTSAVVRAEKVTSRDTRLAGRPRFYDEVGVTTTVSAPWHGEEAEGSVASPISAGVDGSDSASGVHHLRDSGSSKLEYMLSPRKPGSVESPDSCSEWYGVTLDNRILKTPMGQTLAVPSQNLAFGIAAEWDAQAKYLQPSAMPLMTLACTALDQVAHDPEGYRQQCLKFLPTDTVRQISFWEIRFLSIPFFPMCMCANIFADIKRPRASFWSIFLRFFLSFLSFEWRAPKTCFFADPKVDRGLHRRQQDAWGALHGFVEEKLNRAPACAVGASEGMIMVRKREDRNKSVGLPHHRELLDSAAEWTRALDAWHLAALSSICSQAKSFLLGWALLESGSPLRETKQVVEASRVEEEFQISSWGLVEGGHDYDRLNCSIQLHSAEVFSKTILLDNGL